MKTKHGGKRNGAGRKKSIIAIKDSTIQLCCTALEKELILSKHGNSKNIVTHLLNS